MLQYLYIQSLFKTHFFEKRKRWYSVKQRYLKLAFSRKKTATIFIYLFIYLFQVSIIVANANKNQLANNNSRLIFPGTTYNYTSEGLASL